MGKQSGQLPLLLDTSTGDISPAYVQSGKVGSPGHLKAAGKDASGELEETTPTAYTLDELDDVFEQLGHGGLDLATRNVLARRAAEIIAALRTNGTLNNEAASAKRWAMKKAGWLIDETKHEILQPFLTLAKDGDLAALVQDEPSPQNGGVMTLRVPFYVGNSVAYARGIDRKLRFGLEKLDGIIARGNARISESKQPITVYARHAHATSADKLPVGRVVKLERSGGTGYAIEEIAPTTDGRDVQTLARNKMLNATSLRANADSYLLEEITINGEPAWDVDLDLDGIDFAPDGPAQPTYGIEVLAAEARVEPVVITPKRSERVLEEITLEAVRGKTEIVQAIEAPLKEANVKLTQELEKVKADLAAANEKISTHEIAVYVRELAGQFPDPEKALSVIQELCKDEKTKEAIAAKVMPLLLDALKKAPAQTIETPKPPANPFLELFPGSGSGQVIGLEALSGKKAEEGEVVTGLAVPA